MIIRKGEQKRFSYLNKNEGVFKMSTFYDLSPVNNQKSFYGKAKVLIDDNGNKTLYSYETKILTITKTGEYIKHWSDWTATTGKHIKAFCGMNKKQFESLEG